MTLYAVLTQNGDHSWKYQAVVDAHNSDQAIRDYYMRHTPADVLAMVAVPAKSWKPQQVRTETKTRVIVGSEPPSESEK